MIPIYNLYLNVMLKYEQLGSDDVEGEMASELTPRLTRR